MQPSPHARRLSHDTSSERSTTKAATGKGGYGAWLEEKMSSLGYMKGEAVLSSKKAAPPPPPPTDPFPPPQQKTLKPSLSLSTSPLSPTFNASQSLSSPHSRYFPGAPAPLYPFRKKVAGLPSRSLSATSAQQVPFPALFVPPSRALPASKGGRHPHPYYHSRTAPLPAHGGSARAPPQVGLPPLHPSAQAAAPPLLPDNRDAPRPSLDDDDASTDADADADADPMEVDSACETSTPPPEASTSLAEESADTRPPSRERLSQGAGSRGEKLTLTWCTVSGRFLSPQQAAGAPGKNLVDIDFEPDQWSPVVFDDEELVPYNSSARGGDSQTLRNRWLNWQLYSRFGAACPCGFHWVVGSSSGRVTDLDASGEAGLPGARGWKRPSIIRQHVVACPKIEKVDPLKKICCLMCEFKRSLLVHLPPSLLDNIFSRPDVVTLDNVCICKRLLPHTLAALCTVVDLNLPSHLALFVATLVRRPSLFASVEDLLLNNYEDDEWESGGYGQIEDALGGGERILPSWLPKVGIGLAQELLTRLPNLRGLAIGTPVLAPILECEEPISPVRSLLLSLPPSGEDDEPTAWPWTALANAAATFPSLTSLTLSGNEYSLPLTLVNVSPKAELPARACNFSTFNLVRCQHVGPDMRHLVAWFSHSLTRLEIRANHVYDRLMDDLALLPPSLVVINLELGFDCPDYCRTHGYPKLAANDAVLPLDLPSLHHLHLCGDILSAPSFAFLRSCPQLRCIRIGRHAQFTLEDLLSLSPAHNDRDEGVTLTVDLCACTDPSSWSTRRRPFWPKGFGYSDAKRLVEVAESVGFRLYGTVRCAVRQCTPEDGHDCPKWYR
ncbi:hypothetical protein JCM10207_006941 [Rhodosporidiobolus poonsookiae]